MSIKLSYWLLRNKRTVEDFIVGEEINSYADVLAYCEARGCEPISEQEYLAASKAQDVSKKEAKPVEEKKPAAARKNVTKAKRNTKTQTKRKTRASKAQD